MSDCLWPHGLQHAKPPYPLPSLIYIWWVRSACTRVCVCVRACVRVRLSVMSDPLWPHELSEELDRFLCPWDFPGKEYSSGLPCPPPGDLPDLRIEPMSPAWQANSVLLSYQGICIYNTDIYMYYIYSHAHTLMWPMYSNTYKVNCIEIDIESFPWEPLY